MSKTAKKFAKLTLEHLEDRTAPAVTFTWTPVAGTTWTNPSNWTNNGDLGDVYPGDGTRSGDIVVFDGSVSNTGCTWDGGTALALGAIDFQNGYTSTVDVSAATSVQFDGGNWTSTATIAQSGSTVLECTTGDLNISAAVTLTSPSGTIPTFTADSGVAVDLTAILTMTDNFYMVSGSIMDTNAGSLYFNNQAQFYNGGSVYVGGPSTFYVQHAYANSPSYNFSTGIINMSPGDAISFDGPLDNKGEIDLTGSSSAAAKLLSVGTLPTSYNAVSYQQDSGSVLNMTANAAVSANSGAYFTGGTLNNISTTTSGLANAFTNSITTGNSGGQAITFGGSTVVNVGDNTVTASGSYGTLTLDTLSVSIVGNTTVNFNVNGGGGGLSGGLMKLSNNVASLTIGDAGDTGNIVSFKGWNQPHRRAYVTVIKGPATGGTQTRNQTPVMTWLGTATAIRGLNYTLTDVDINLNQDDFVADGSSALDQVFSESGDTILGEGIPDSSLTTYTLIPFTVPDSGAGEVITNVSGWYSAVAYSSSDASYYGPVTPSFTQAEVTIYSMNEDESPNTTSLVYDADVTVSKILLGTYSDQSDYLVKACGLSINLTAGNYFISMAPIEDGTEATIGLLQTYAGSGPPGMYQYNPSGLWGWTDNVQWYGYYYAWAMRVSGYIKAAS